MEATQYGPVLVGLTAIGALFQRSRWTARRWIADEDFPAARLPNGEWTTTLSLIDGWILARAQETAAEKAKMTADYLGISRIKFLEGVGRNIASMTITKHEEQG